jgi:hypothetical protein
VSSEAEMRSVIQHAAGQLRAVQERALEGGSRYNHGYDLPLDVVISLAYAEGIFRLLASYLKVGGEPQANGQRPTEAVTDPAGAPAEKVERNAAVVAAMRAGGKRRDVAERFGISERRVSQLVDAASATKEN